MKQEASKKSKKWLWLVLGLVLLLAVAGVVLALVFGGSSGDTDGPTGGRPDLYWNVARESHLDPETGLSVREAAPDGLYYITFAHNGEQVEYPVSDKKLVNYIDSMDIMGLTFDNEGYVVDVIAPTDIATEVGKNLYVQSVSGNMLIANSSIAMNGMRFNINISELTEIYEVSGAGEFEGVKIDASALLSMDTITVYANDLEEVTHIYLSDHPVESKVYWRATQQYNSTEKSTAREPDENGDYTLDFYCEGELVEFKTKDKSIATSIDSVSRYSAHFGLRFDEDGYVVEVLNSAIASRTILACQRFDITEFDGETFTATRLLTNDGSYYTGTINENTVVYDVSLAAQAEGRMGKQVDSIQLGDRVCVWTDASGNVVLIYVANRIVDSPAYYVPTRKYSSKLKETTREPDANGVYSIELLKEGDSENTTYYTTDKALMTVIDADTDKCVGLKADENNNIIYVYDPECLFGYTAFCRGRFVTEVTGTIFSSVVSSDPENPKNGVMTPDCKIYNVSKAGEYGAETTLQVGDVVYAWRQPTGEIVHVYVNRRYLGEDTLYYCLDTQYDSENKCTTREKDANGWYYLTFAYQGKQVTLKTKDVEIVNAIDSLRATVPAASLEVSGDVITKVYGAEYATGGSKIASGYRIKSFNADGTITAYYKEKEVTFKLADDVVVYNVSPVVNSHQGEQIKVSDLKIGDMLTVYTDWTISAKVIYVRQRYVDNMYWKYDRFYNSTDEVTSRVPDADGWYWYDLAVNGEVKKLKTKDVKVASSMDKYEGAFGLYVVGDEIKGFTGVSSVRDCSSNGVTNWTVTKVEGNKVTLTYTYSGSNLGKTQTITLASDAKIYDVSDVATKWGGKATLKVGDVIRTYLSRDGETHQYVYIRGRCTREAGYMSYCDHCDEVVYWNPYIKNSSISTNNHYYLPGDIENTSQITYGSESKEYEAVLDLYGHTLTRNNGRVSLIRYGEILNIMDSVGGGKIVGAGSNANGGVIMMFSGGKLNLYAGTIALTDDEAVTPNYGGVVYLSGKDCVFNMYDGTITGGRSYMQDDYDYARGGNLYISSGTFNMYGGTITGGKAYNGEKPVLDDQGKPVLDNDEKPKMSLVRAYGGNIYSSGGTVNLCGGSVVDGWSEGYGGNMYAGSGTVTLDKGTKLTGGIASTTANTGAGGNIYIGKANVTINKATVDGGKILRESSSCAGGNIYCRYEGSLTINDGAVISNGTAYGMGGNIYVAGAQKDSTTGEYSRKFTLTINGGTITGGTSTAYSGGNIAFGAGEDEAKSASYFYMYGGTVSNGTCAEGTFGGNIYLITENGLIAGGTVTGGKAGDTDYDIYVSGSNHGLSVTGGTVNGKFRINDTGTINISGAPKIAQLNLAKNVSLTVGEMKSGASVAMFVTTNPFSEPCANAQAYVDAEYFTAYEEGCTVKVDENNRMSIAGEARSAYCEHCQQTVTWEAWMFEGGEKIGSGGHYYLTESLSISSQYGIGTSTSDTQDDAIDLVLDLNGYDINSTRAVFYVYPYSSLSIQGEGNVSGVGTTTSRGIRNGGIIYTEGHTTLNIYGGTYTLNDTDMVAHGGVIYTSSNSVVNIYDGVFNGNALPSEKYGGVIYAKDELNIYGGTFNGGTCDYGSAIFMAGATTKLTISDAAIDGQVYLNNEDASISLSGSVQITDLYLRNGNVATVTALVEGTQIVINAPGQFAQTDVAANEYLNYFSTSVTGKVVTADGNTLSVTDPSAEGGGNEDEETPDPTDTPLNDVYAAAVQQTTGGVFASGETVTAPCPYCSANGDTADKEWTALGATGTLSGGHYYVAQEITGNTNHYTITGNVCVHLNGNNITSTKRVFHVDSAGTLNVMGDGIITGGYKNDNSAHFAATLDSVGTVNLCGGTWKRASDAPVIDGRGTSIDGIINIYNGTTVQGDSSYTGYALVALLNKTTMNIYGGTITGGTWTDGNGGNICIKANTYSSREGGLNIYGGTISGGSATLGGNIYAEGGTSALNVNIQGGTITGGSVYVDSNVTSLSVSGGAVIENLDLSDGTIVELGTLTADANIAVTAPGVFTDVLSNANDYLTYISAYEAGKKIEVTTSNTLSVVADSGEEGGEGTDENLCPCCGEPMDEITWTEIEAGSSALTIETSGHYYLSGNVAVTSNSHGLNLPDDKNITVTLDLRGNSLTTTGKSGIQLGKRNTLNLMDSVGGGYVAGGSATFGGTGIYVYTGSVLNLYSGTVNGSAGTSANGGTLFLANSGTANIYGGTVNGTAAGKNGGAVYATVTDENTTTLNVYGGTINAGTAGEGYNGDCIYMNNEDATSTAVLNISGGTINGEVYVGATVDAHIEGNPVVTNLDVTSGVLLDLGTMTEGAEVTVNAVKETPFTDALTDAASYEPYFKAVGDGLGVVAKESKLLVTEVCPHCGDALADITWTELSYTDTVSSSVKLAPGHYRLMSDVSATSNLFCSDTEKSGTIVFDTNGYSITSGRRLFYLANTDNAVTFHLLDSVGTSELKSDNSYVNKGVAGAPAFTGMWLYASAGVDLRVYGGSFSAVEGFAAGTSTTGGRFIYSNGGTIRILGGTFDASNAASAYAMYSDHKDGGNEIYISGGMFIGGDAPNVWAVRAETTLDISGGTFEGKTLVAGDATVNISGAPVVNELDLTSGAKVTIGMLTKDASVVLNGTGELTMANVNAQAYIDAGYISACQGITLSVEDNVIIGTAETAG